MTNATLAYSTTTGEATPYVITGRLRTRDEVVNLFVEPVESAPWIDPFCHVCGRCTDHFAEHDDLVGAGLASYQSDGSVSWTPFARTEEGDRRLAEVLAAAQA